MKNLIAYFSKSGNTQLVAEGIAEELQCESIDLGSADINQIKLKEIDCLFIGSGVYLGKYDESLISLIKSLNSLSLTTKKPLKLAFFVTWLGRGRSDLSAVNHCKKLIRSERIIPQDNYYKCLGESFKLIRKGHPDADDILNARIWARSIVGENA